MFPGYISTDSKYKKEFFWILHIIMQGFKFVYSIYLEMGMQVMEKLEVALSTC